MTPVERFSALPVTQRVREMLRPGAQRAAGGLWGGSAALLIAALAESRDRSILVVTAEDGIADDVEGDLGSFSQRRPLRLVEQEIDVEDRPEATALGRRLEVLRELATTEPFILLASLPALLDAVPKPRELRSRRLALRTGQQLTREALVQRAAAAGLRRVPVVLGPGEFSARGDVVDVFGLGAPLALRVELFDGEIESLRRFDPASQRSLGVLEDAEIPLGSGDAGALAGHVMEHVVRDGLLVVMYEPLQLDESRQAITLHRPDGSRQLQLFHDIVAGLTQLAVSSLPSHDLDFKILSAGSAAGSGEADPVGRLRSIRGIKRGEVHILCRTDTELQRLREIFEHKKLSLRKEKVHLRVGALSRGFRIPDSDVTFISNVEFAGVPQSTRVRERPNLPTKALASFFELGPGDLVVHAAHGIAEFEGMERVERGDACEDHLRLRFRDDVLLLVPASKIHLVQKYVGAGTASPQLDRLGGKGFARRKEEVSRALFDLAADLLEVQARRATTTRAAYPRDPLETEFLDAFPFTDTDDQRVAWEEIQGDLEKAQVSDRLLCGDVGFGKTELAMRAAFKVAITGRQVAVLVPTTVLAEQHGRTFGARFAPFALEVAVLSRFTAGAKRKAALEQLRTGAIDVLIGTHRILSDDVAFHDLGLVVVDEEQRFGVRHKEKLKRMRADVDLLTLSATPIPRTLHSALLGVRGISTLATPPAGRQDVETRVAFWDRALVAEALHRELARGGQVFVLHNRVETLDHVAREVQQLAAAARVVIGHGRMTAAQVEKTIRTFISGNADVLVSTSIIENGLDLPNANTILVDRADRFGLAELHQLRGRVGRSDRKAHCLLLLDRSHPPRDEAKKRLKALEEFAHLGAGFAIAMKDLEIRGAGNLLGPQQSGHIAAVGYEMYCDLLRGAVDAARRHGEITAEEREVDVDMQVQAFLPDHLVQDAKDRLDLLREMDGAVDAGAAVALARDLVDRFGALPAAMTNLLLVFCLKHALLAHGVLGAQFTGDDRIIVRQPRGHPLGGAWLDQFGDVRPVEAGKTHLLLPGRRRRPWRGEQVMDHLLDALLQQKAAARIRRACGKRTRGNKARG